MNKNKQKIIWIVVATAFVLLACAPKKPAPIIASSAESAGYAAEFPVDMNSQTFLYKESEAKSNENTTAFKGYPEQLTDPDWKVVLAAVEAADQEGRGQAYADRMAETRMARKFFDREKEDITRRVNGAVTIAVEKAECNCELESYGKISYALKDAVDRKLEERLLEPSDAYRIIEKNEKAIGKKNVEPLKEQVAAIAYTAHVVFVLLPQSYQEIERRLAEVKKVKGTLQDAIEAEDASAAEKGITKKEKKAREKKAEELRAALAAIDGYQQEAEKLVTRAETEIPKLQKKYETAFEELVTKLEKKAGK